MINQLEIPMYLDEALPDMHHDLIVNKEGSPYEIMKMLTDYTSQVIKEHNYKVAKRCFQVADKLYCKGNHNVKNAVQNVFVYSFTRMFQIYSAEKQQLLAMLPITLYTLYITQLNHGGC